MTLAEEEAGIGQVAWCDLVLRLSLLSFGVSAIVSKRLCRRKTSVHNTLFIHGYAHDMGLLVQSWKGIEISKASNNTIDPDSDEATMDPEKRGQSGIDVSGRGPVRYWAHIMSAAPIVGCGMPWFLTDDASTAPVDRKAPDASQSRMTVRVAHGGS